MKKARMVGWFDMVKETNWMLANAIGPAEPREDQHCTECPLNWGATTLEACPRCGSLLLTEAEMEAEG